MKRKFVCALICLLPIVAKASVHEYASNSILSDGTFIKVSVQETGVHSLSYDTLKGWGLNPEQVAILGYGGAMLSEDFTQHHWDDLPSVPFYMHKGSDGAFNSGDYILFYAQGPTSWEVTADNKWIHKQNVYSDYGYYFITDKQGLQKQIQLNDDNYDTSSLIEVDWYMSLNVYEKDSVNLIDLKGSSGGGREFYGEFLNTQNRSKSFDFALNNVRTDVTASCVVDLAASSSEKTPIQVSYAGSTETVTLEAIKVSDYYTKATTSSANIVVQPKAGNKQTVSLYFRGTRSGANAYLNYIELLVPCGLSLVGDEMAIVNSEYFDKSSSIRYLMNGANANTQIWRVTDGVSIEKMPVSYSNGELSWIGSNKSIERYVAINVNGKNWKQPVRVGVVKNQNLHALENVDYVIICPESFKEPSIRLAKKHEEIDGLTWAVVTDQEVYNEFSSGTPDASAYRWLMKMLYDRAKGDVVREPKNLLLMGDGTYDNRKRFSTSGVRQLLTFQAKNSTSETEAYATDDYFGFLDNEGIYEGKFNEVHARMNIGVGRLPVKTLAEADSVVAKICTYMDDQVLGKWKSQILFLADDGDHGLHVQTADGGAERLRKKNKNFIVNKIYLDAHTQEVSAAGESYPLAKNQFDNLMNSGVLFMDYSGHGGYNNITNELFMKSADIQKMKNVNQGFWFLATCSFSHFDGGVTSAGELAVLNPNGGAIGVLSACRTVYATQNTVLNRNLCDTLFGHKTDFDYHMTLGEATRIAKNRTGYDSNKLPYILLADPAIKLNYPTDLLVKTTVHLDTIHALSVQTIEGYIQTSNHDTATWFNGTMDVTIFDKIQQITTRDNDETIDANKTKITYNDYPNTLFSGKADVVNGKFSFSFMVPKDIRYNYGNGRIVYYAHDPETREEAVGHYEDFVIGGSDNTLLNKDTVGPSLTIYLNSPAFKTGDQTYEFPHFYADIIDSSGINTVGTGIGHDLLLMIDDDPKQTYVLNNYFTANNNSYRSGQVSYKMMEQSEGAHRLTFRAWDLCNNSSTASLNFYVVKGLDPNIYSVSTYPNPVSTTGVMNVEIQYDQPDEVVQTTIYLYDISGQILHTHTQNGVAGITWNMSQIAAKPGIYVYQVKIKTATSDFVTKAGKIIVTK